MGTPYRLTLLRDEVRELIADYKPDVVAIERVLFQHNAATAISVGQAIGIVMTEGVSAGCEVVEYSPNEVKQAVAGHGGADKEEMEKMVRLLLGIGTPLQPVDAADALALSSLLYSPPECRGTMTIGSIRGQLSRLLRIRRSLLK